MRRRTTRTELLIAGMRDNHGRERISEELERVKGVHQVIVNLYLGQAVVLHEPWCMDDDLVRAVAAAGYRAALPAGPPKSGAGVRGRTED